MVLGLKSRTSWVLCLVGIITVGILSRVGSTGLVVVDKYLGYALYAAMVYTILRLFWRAAASARLAASAMAVMTAIELFQLTIIPAQLLANEHVMVRICARLDRKSTRLNSSHLGISHPVFCLKKTYPWPPLFRRSSFAWAAVCNPLTSGSRKLTQIPGEAYIGVVSANDPLTGGRLIFF